MEGTPQMNMYYAPFFHVGAHLLLALLLLAYLVGSVALAYTPPENASISQKCKMDNLFVGSATYASIFSLLLMLLLWGSPVPL